ncbi:MAG: YgiT-type zinc finger protein [Planctomycetaceae bacterium]
MMKCIHCQGKMIRDVAPFHVDRKGYHLLLDAVPAWVCTQCGEPLFDQAEVQTIQAAISAVDVQADKLAAAAP